MSTERMRRIAGDWLPRPRILHSSLAEHLICLQAPEVGAECVNCACSDLSGGRSVMGVPTAIPRQLFFALGDPPRLTSQDLAPGAPRRGIAPVLIFGICSANALHSVRVEAKFCAEVEAVLAEGESLSKFVEASVRASVDRRRTQSEFIARGLRSRDEARRTQQHIDADSVIDALQRKLDAVRARIPKTTP